MAGKYKAPGYNVEQVGAPRYHVAMHGKVDAPIAAGDATKTSRPSPPKPAVGAGKGFRGI